MDSVLILLAQVSLYFDVFDIGAHVVLKRILDALRELVLVQLGAIHSLYVFIVGLSLT